MSIGFPRTDILSSAVGFTDQAFKLMSVQELSRVASGISIGKDFGSAIWMSSYTTEQLRNDDAVAYEAMLNSLDGVIFPFEACDLRREKPRRHIDGSGNNGVLAVVNANKKAVALSGLAAGQIISAGDYLSFDFAGRRALHQAMETAVTLLDGTTQQFEVRPHLRPGWSLGLAVNLKAPRGIFNLVPGSVTTRTTNTQTVISFQTVQLA